MIAAQRALQAQAKATAVVKATDKERELEMLWQHARINRHMTFSYNPKDAALCSECLLSRSSGSERKGSGSEGVTFGGKSRCRMSSRRGS